MLTDAIHNQRAGGGTALNDAIYRASEILSNPPLPTGPDPEVRRVIVVISDGDDNLSDHALSDAIEAAIRSETAVYAISTNTDWLAIDDATKPSKYHLTDGDKMLQKFADQTGGRVFFPYRIDDLAQSFLDIGTELRSQYFIAYAPAIPLSHGQYRKIEVQTNRKGSSCAPAKAITPCPVGPPAAPLSTSPAKFVLVGSWFAHSRERVVYCAAVPVKGHSPRAIYLPQTSPARESCSTS